MHEEVDRYSEERGAYLYHTPTPIFSMAKKLGVSVYEQIPVDSKRIKLRH